MSTPVQQNNSTPINTGSAIPSLGAAGSSTVGSQLPTLATTSPLYERVINQLGGGHVFRLQRNGVTFATGIMENDVALQLHATYKPAATAQIVKAGANAIGNGIATGGQVVGQVAGARVGGGIKGALVSGAIGAASRGVGGMASKLLSANKAASALSWDFQDAQYWNQDVRFTLIRVGTSGEQDVVQRFYALAEAVTTQEAGGVFTGPYGMALESSLVDGSLGLTLMVGNWLVVDDLLVTSLTSDFSRVVTVDGKPYMAGCTMHVQSRTAISHNVDLKRFLGQ